MARLISLVMTFLTIHLLTRHRQAEITDGQWLEAYKRTHYSDAPAHGPSWRVNRNSTNADAWIFETARQTNRLSNLGGWPQPPSSALLGRVDGVGSEPRDGLPAGATGAGPDAEQG